MRRKRGYTFFLAFTIIFTLAAAIVVASGWLPISGMPEGIDTGGRLLIAVLFLFLSGASCIARKRFFISE